MIQHQPVDTRTAFEQVSSMGITRRQFDYWCNLGLIYDADEKNPGTGFARRQLTIVERYRLAVMASLVNDGVAPRTAHRAAVELTETGRATIGGLTFGRAETQTPAVVDSAA